MWWRALVSREICAEWRKHRHEAIADCARVIEKMQINTSHVQSSKGLGVLFLTEQQDSLEAQEHA